MGSERFIPAAGRRWLTGLYDPFLAATMRERRWRTSLIDEVLAGQPDVVLDLGCGTGTLAVQLARRAPDTRVIGLDGDPTVLKRAADKATAAGVALQLVEALVDDIPLEDATVDCAVSSLVLHHLALEAKRRALTEARRILRPAGRLVIADWGRAHDPVMRIAFTAVQLLDGFQTTKPHASGELPGLIEDAGFDVRPHDRMRTMWGTLDLLVATPTLAPQPGGGATPARRMPPL